MSSSATHDSQITGLLNDCRSRIYWHTLLQGLAMVIATLLLVILLVTSLDYLIGLPGGIRALGLVALAATAAGGILRWLLIPLLQPVPAKELGAAVDLAQPQLRESLSTLLSLEESDVTAGESGSALMRKRIEQQLTGQLNQISTEDVVDTRTTRKRSGFAASLIVIAGIPLCLWPSGSALLLHRMVAPFSNLATASNLFFEVPDGNRTVATASDVVIRAIPRWRTGSSEERPDNVELQLIAADGNRTAQVHMSYDEIDNIYTATITRVEESFRYRIMGGGAVSQTFDVQVVDAPEIIAATLIAEPPAYCGCAVRRFDGVVGEIEVFERSELEIQLQFSKPVESAVLVWLNRDAFPESTTAAFNREFDHVTGEEVMTSEDDATDWDPLRSMKEPATEEPAAEHFPDPEDLDPDAPWLDTAQELAERVPAEVAADGLSARIVMSADVGGDFVFEVRDEFHLANPQEPDRRLRVTFDTPPELSVASPVDGFAIRPDDILPVDCLAFDDIGLGRLELHYRVNDDVTRIVPAAGLQGGLTQFEHAFRVALEDLTLSDNDRVTYRVLATDERPVPGPQQTWSRQFSVTINSNADAAGAEAMAEEAKAMIDTLEQLRAELEKDASGVRDLKQTARKQWDDDARQKTQRLSEKEQQQGRALEQIAERVATHPLMQEPAETLQQMSQQLRSDIPKDLNEAVNEDRGRATQQLQSAERQLQEIQRDLQRQIQEIKARAELEQKLAELNRLALDAEQLAADSDQLDDDRTRDDARSADVSEEQWQQELASRQEQLQKQQQQLTGDLNNLLDRENELLQSAQQSQRDELQEIAERARQLADQQSRVAQGVRDEAREAGRDAQTLAGHLDNVRRDMQLMNQELKKHAPDVARPDPEPLKEAAQQLRRGNLADPPRSMSEAEAELTDVSQQLGSEQKKSTAEQDGEAGESASDQNNGNEASQQMAPAQQQHFSDHSRGLADRLQSLRDQIDELRADRNLDPASTRQQSNENSTSPATTPATAASAAPAEQSAAEASAEGNTEEGSNGESGSAVAEKPIADMLQRIQDLAEAAGELAESVDADPAARQSAKNAAQQTVREAQQGLQEAAAGRFSKSAQEMRQAGRAAQQSAEQSQGPGQEDTREQLRGLSDELGHLADTLENLQRDDSSQVIAQQLTQQDISEAAGELPQQLADLADRMSVEGLQMQGESGRAQQAGQSASEAQQSTEQASSQLQTGQLQQASDTGNQAAQQLRETAQQAQQGKKNAKQQPSRVPGEVGESVVDALQNLAKAAQSMQDGAGENASPGPGEASRASTAAANSDQPGQGQPSESNSAGQPGKSGQPDGSNKSSSAAQSLSSAAEALAQAARNALPNQFTPGQNAGTGQGNGGGTGATGNAALWDGLLPSAIDGLERGRNWGQQNQELDTETSDGIRVTRDSEYQALIRRYFQEVARATAAEK